MVVFHAIVNLIGLRHFNRRGGMAGGTCLWLALANDFFTFT